MTIYYSSLNPKSYYATDGTTVKAAAKGVQGKSNFRYEQYKAVLYNDQNINVENTVFRARDGGMSTLVCKKIGLSGTFIKANLLDDKITVRPHNRHINP